MALLTEVKYAKTHPFVFIENTLGESSRYDTYFEEKPRDLRDTILDTITSEYLNQNGINLKDYNENLKKSRFIKRELAKYIKEKLNEINRDLVISLDNEL